ncbi:MAG TPA: hypothetical protein ENN19_13750 [Chloroflexi bacterium]|nr:hypothetical protein [Chloroflexota bacterium]
MADKQPVPPQDDPVQEVDRIRDIIFGSQMRDYDQRFQVIMRDLERQQQELDHLSERLSEQDGAQTKKLQQESDRLSERLAMQDSEQGKKLERLRKESRAADDDLRRELRETAQQLMDDKVNRLALGEMLIEIGTRLKTGTVASDLLERLEDIAQV